jgi:hypothetical protein
MASYAEEVTTRSTRLPLAVPGAARPARSVSAAAAASP